MIASTEFIHLLGVRPDEGTARNGCICCKFLSHGAHTQREQNSARKVESEASLMGNESHRPRRPNKPKYELSMRREPGGSLRAKFAEQSKNIFSSEDGKWNFSEKLFAMKHNARQNVSIRLNKRSAFAKQGGGGGEKMAREA